MLLFYPLPHYPTTLPHQRDTMGNRLPFDVLRPEFAYGQYLKYKGLVLYVRRSRRISDGALIPCFDIARVQATKKGHKFFTKFLIETCEYLSCHHPDHGIYVECVMNPRFSNYLERIGGISDQQFSPSYIFPPNILPSLREGLINSLTISITWRNNEDSNISSLIS